MIRTLFLTLLTAAICSAPAMGLTPDQVLVVANSRSKESVELAETYAKLRSIPPQNIVLVATTEDYYVSHKTFKETLNDALRRGLGDGGGYDLR